MTPLRALTRAATIRVCLLLGAAATAACTRGPDAGDQFAADTTEAPAQAAAGSGASIDSGAPIEPQVTAQAADPFGVFGLESSSDATATMDTTAAWLINRLDAALVVTGDAGAGSVVIDTIPPADSILVRIRTLADSVRLSARTYAGAARGAATLLIDGTERRVAFPR